MSLPPAHSLIAAISPFVGVGGFLLFTVLLPIIFWGRRVEEKLDTIKNNHLAHVEENTARMSDSLIRAVTLLEIIAEKITKD